MNVYYEYEQEMENSTVRSFDIYLIKGGTKQHVVLELHLRLNSSSQWCFFFFFFVHIQSPRVSLGTELHGRCAGVYDSGVYDTAA